ncbi:MAG TPA: flagellar biosynthesis anti-sigma factor FlgM [Candidatus Limnocylindria bacterium]|nr:flagellar biosynthesis anti-sigma factor FlgM [Candidatus Limnocylindria bacterium]
MRIGNRIVLSAPRPAGVGVPARRLAAAKLLATLNACRDWAPDAERSARIDALRSAVKSGTYRIDYERTARTMLGEIIGEALT